MRGPNIPPKSNRRWKNYFSPFLCRDRNAIERIFCPYQTWRNLHVPLSIACSCEMYSDHWPCDTFSASMVKLFVILSDITEADDLFTSCRARLQEPH